MFPLLRWWLEQDSVFRFATLFGTLYASILLLSKSSDWFYGIRQVDVYHHDWRKSKHRELPEVQSGGGNKKMVAP